MPKASAALCGDDAWGLFNSALKQNLGLVRGVDWLQTKTAFKYSQWYHGGTWYLIIITVLDSGPPKEGRTLIPTSKKAAHLVISWEFERAECLL